MHLKNAHWRAFVTRAQHLKLLTPPAQGTVTCAFSLINAHIPIPCIKKCLNCDLCDYMMDRIKKTRALPDLQSGSRSK